MNDAFRLAAPIVLIAVCGGGGYGLGKIAALSEVGLPGF
jgi:hypothetical protein